MTKPARPSLNSGKSVKEGLVSKIASKFQQQFDEGDLSVSRKTSVVSNPEKPTTIDPLTEAQKKISRTESHHARFNNAR